MSGKKILIVSTTKFLGGGEKFLLNSITKLNADCNFIVLSKSLENELIDKRQYVEYIENCNLFSYIRKIKSYVKKNEYDAIIFNGGNSLYLSLFIRHPNKILYKHSTYEGYPSKIKRCFAIFLTELNTFFCKKIVHVSKYSQSQQIFNKHKSIVIYHGLLNKNVLEPKKLSTEDLKPFKLLYVGRLESAKGIDKIIKVFLNYNLNNIKLLIIGDGVLNNWIKNLNNDNIEYHGYQQDPSKFYRQADALITLPKFEAFGLTILEGMSCGLPVIATNVGGIPEILKNNYNGLFTSNNEKDIIESITKIATNNDLYNILSQHALETAAKFSIEFTLKQIEELL